MKFSVCSISWIFPEFHVNNTAVGEKAVAVQSIDCADPEIHTASISIAFSDQAKLEYRPEFLKSRLSLIQD